MTFHMHFFVLEEEMKMFYSKISSHAKMKIKYYLFNKLIKTENDLLFIDFDIKFEMFTWQNYFI